MRSLRGEAVDTTALRKEAVGVAVILVYLPWTELK
jgi:hypothetical protein